MDKLAAKFKNLKKVQNSTDQNVKINTMFKTSGPDT